MSLGSEFYLKVEIHLGGACPDLARESRRVRGESWSIPQAIALQSQRPLACCLPQNRVAAAQHYALCSPPYATNNSDRRHPMLVMAIVTINCLACREQKQRRETVDRNVWNFIRSACEEYRVGIGGMHAEDLLCDDPHVGSKRR